MGNTDIALALCQYRLNTQKSVIGPNHSHTTRALMVIDRVFQKTDLDEALKHYQAALSLFTCATTRGYQVASECLKAIGYLYSTTGMLTLPVPGFLMRNRYFCSEPLEVVFISS